MVDNPHQQNLDEYSIPTLSHGPVCVYVCDLLSYLILSTQCLCLQDQGCKYLELYIVSINIQLSVY